jgi:hypothetical protein
MKLLKNILVLFVIFLTGKVYSQTNLKSFTDDQALFLEEMADFLAAVDKKEAKLFMLEGLDPAWNSGKLTFEQKAAIIQTCNFMLKKRLKPYPDFRNYMGAIVNFTNSTQSPESFKAWMQSVEKVKEAKTMTPFLSFIEMSEGLFKNNSIFKSATTEWQASVGDYRFEYDSVPRVVFGKINLRCYAKGDSSLIQSTKGVYYPTSSMWYGNGGKVDWKRAGIDENMSYAELSRYKISFKSPSFQADSVTYYNKSYFAKPLLGKLIDKVMVTASEDRASYPEFSSYDKRLQINNIYPEVDYDGGFLVRGAKVIGSGDDENPAMLKFKRDKKLFLLATAKSFIIRTDRISSEKATTTIYWENDSIYHPGMQFKFIFKDKEVSMIRDNQGMARTPFFNSFHQLDMYVEAVYWKVDEPTITMRMIQGSNENNAAFESSSYFKDSRFMKLMGMADVHPFGQIRDYTTKHKTMEVPIMELSKSMRMPTDQLRTYLLYLAQQGFVIYQSDKDKIIVKDRLIDYLKYKGAKKDYDVLVFNSEQGRNQDNAQINLLNFDLKIYGVERIALSDSQIVYITPTEGKVTVKKNRDFSFAGAINAGRFQFFGKEFSFEYDKFKINLTNVDSLRIKVVTKDRDRNGEPIMAYVNSVIEYINGDLLIDHYNNKSGRVDYPQYPIFNSKKESFCYWDKRNVFGNVYTRDKVVFQLDPFTIDSLDNFTNDALAFQGTFESGGIFPEFRETLRLMDDYSLGFTTYSPPGGYPMYGNKGKCVAEIKMSNRGLRGNGTLDYIQSTTKSRDFRFFLDSMNTLSDNFYNRNQATDPQYPKVNADSAFVKWRPYQDYMKILNKPTRPFQMYDGVAEHKGRLVLNPKNLRGAGTIGFYKAELDAMNMVFKERMFDADTSDIRIQSAGAADIGISTKNFAAHIDFDEKVGEFKSNGGGSYVKFPVNQYLCYMDQFKWFMEKDNLELSSDSKRKGADQSAQGEDLDLSGAEFISIHPDQDSLRFLSPRARYDIKNSVIYCHEVRYINVADARIFPDNGDVTVQKKAKIETLTNAGILANTVTKYHKMFNATIDIYGRKSYAGSADYNYIDENSTEQKVSFDKVATDATNQTIAEGVIPETANFQLSPYFEYKGKIALKASNQLLSFIGSFRLNHNCAVTKRWVDFSGDVNPAEVYIPLGDTVYESGSKRKIISGLFNATDSVHTYTAFLTPKRGNGDYELISSNGYVYYDKESREYRIASKEKIKEMTALGNYMSLNVGSCQAYAEGQFTLSKNLGQVKLTTFGAATHNMVNDTVTFELILGIDFFFENSAIKAMIDKFEANTSLLPVPFNRPVYERALAEWLGKKEADRLISQVNLYGAFKRLPDDMEKTLFLSDVKMKWNPATKSFISVGPIGIGVMNKTQMNKYVKGKIELVQKRSGDFLNIYLEDDNSNWYFFNYQTGTMMAISSDEKFNTIIKELKPEKRKQETKEKGAAPYQFTLGTPNKKSAFLRKFESYSD